MSSTLLCALLLATAVGLGVRPDSARRRLVALPGPFLGGRGETEPGALPSEPVAGMLRGPPAAAAVGGLGAAVVVGGWAGVVVGFLVAVGAYRVLGRLEPVAVRRRRLRIAADLPLTVDLLVVCLRAGRPISTATAVVGEAVGGPLAEELRRVGARIELGGDPRSVWADSARDAALGPLARAVVRALETGSPVAESLTCLADDLRLEGRAAADEAARRVAVRSAGPLGLCFLPAFVLVGIAPTIIGAFSSTLRP